MDTSALYPLFVKDDVLNHLSTEVLKELKEKYKARFLTTTWVKYETLSKLKKHGINFCLKFEQFLEEAGVSVEYISKSLENSGLKFFWNYKDKEWGIIDCVSISIMNDRNILYAFACDNHFSQAGLLPLIEYDSTGNPSKSYAELYFP